MKSTIKTQFGGSIIVAPGKCTGLVLVTVKGGGENSDLAFIEMTPDQVGALMFGMEMALQAMGVEC